MKIDGRTLTPEDSRYASVTNYCWWNGEARFRPYYNVGHVFETREAFAKQVIRDYPHGLPPAEIKGFVYTHGTGCAIGGDGFGWIHLDQLERFWTRFPHIGGVWFGENVELGSNVTIDRGAIGDTEIGDGVKMDNGVHIGHNAQIGRNTLITAHAIVGGSAVVGRDCYLGLGSIIKNHVKVGNGVTIGMGAIILEDVPNGETWIGNPGRKLR